MYNIVLTHTIYTTRTKEGNQSNPDPDVHPGYR